MINPIGRKFGVRFITLQSGDEAVQLVQELVSDFLSPPATADVVDAAAWPGRRLRSDLAGKYVAAELYRRTQSGWQRCCSKAWRDRLTLRRFIRLMDWADSAIDKLS